MPTGPLAQPFHMPLVGVHLSLDQWIRLLGYLEGVGCGDEMEHHGWIYNQISGYLERNKEDE